MITRTVPPKVTLVVPAFNAEGTLAETLESVRRQSFADWHCLIIDDGSTDRTAAVPALTPDPRLRLISQAHQGVAAARNTGLTLTDSDYVLFLDADDRLHSTALERLAGEATNHPEAIAVFGTTTRLLSSGEEEPGQRPPEKHSFNSGAILRAMITHDRVFWNGGQVLIKTATAKAIGGYRTSLRLNEDWEFFCRLAASGNCVFIGRQQEILQHRISPNSSAPRLSSEWANHAPAIAAVFANEELRNRFSQAEWRRMHDEVTAYYMFEAGRQNFTQARFAIARRLMFNAIAIKPSKRRLAFFLLALASEKLKRPLHGRLRLNV
jgi:glycosyltransferase involved in cell wall biosynthesis